MQITPLLHVLSLAAPLIAYLAGFWPHNPLVQLAGALLLALAPGGDHAPPLLRAARTALRPVRLAAPDSSATLQAPPERAALQELLRHQQAEDNAQTPEARGLAKVGRQRAALQAAELLRALGVGCLCLAAGALLALACATPTGALRSDAEQAVALCRREPGRCAAVRVCTAAAARAGDAWVAVSRLREADARHRAGQGAAVDLQHLADAEAAARELDAAAHGRCTPAALAAPPPAPPPADAGAAPPHDLVLVPRRDGGDL